MGNSCVGCWLEGPVLFYVAFYPLGCLHYVSSLVGQLGLFTCLREKETERQCVHPRQKPQSSYNLISEVTLHHFCYSLLTRSKLLNPTQTPWIVLQENMNTRKWKSLGASVYTFQKLKLENQTASCMSMFKRAQQPIGKSPGVHQQKNGHTKCGIFIQWNTIPP